jgi:3-carboxy-cis,cis-muconate cycloisomerase
VQSGRTLYDVLAAEPAVTQHLDEARLKALLDPANYVGEAHAFVDAVLASYANALPRTPHSSSQTHQE